MRRRLLIVLLSFGMILQSVCAPPLAGTAYAAELLEENSGSARQTEDSSQTGDDGEAGTEDPSGSADGSDTGDQPDGSGSGTGDQSGSTDGSGTGDQSGSTDGSGTGDQSGSTDESGTDDQPGDASSEDGSREEESGTEPPETEEDPDPEEPGDVDEGQEDPAENELLPDEKEEAAQVSGNDIDEEDLTGTVEEAELEGVYQFGGAPSGREQGSISVYSASAYSSGLEEYLCEQIRKRAKEIDVSSYDLNRESLGKAISGVLNEHPEFYYVGKSYRYTLYGEKIGQILFTYVTGYDDAALQNGVSSAMATVSAGMSELEKAIALHDYLVLNCAYDMRGTELPDEAFTIYGVFAEGTAVCQGYALAYKYLLKQAGIDCYMVTSDSMNHAWNMIKLDGKYYQVDVTWDDPVWDRTGRVSHAYMFRSDAAFDKKSGGGSGHSDWQVTCGSDVVGYTATDTRYDEAFWTGSQSPLVMLDGGCYYVSSDRNIRKASLANVAAAGSPIQSIRSWPVWGGSTGQYWGGAFSGLFQIRGRLFYNDKSSIYSIAPDGTDPKLEFTADTTEGYIYGSALRKGEVLYVLHQSPNLSGVETVLKAVLSAEGGESVDPGKEGAALNLENLSAEYTALDGTKISSVAKGRPKLLVFYRNGCGNSKTTIASISSRISEFAGVDICAVEVSADSSSTVEAGKAFQKQYGCSAITFSCDTGYGNNNSMWRYLRAAGLYETSITLPVLCYIDAQNRLQYVSTSYMDADTVLSNLKEYCGYGKENMLLVQPPKTTTYKIGQKLNIAGGKVTYPAGAKMLTKTLTASMVSGFDSSRPGLCRVTVSCAGYTAKFDTLIVEEPAVEASYGQKLNDVRLPANADGVYSWENGAQILNRAGVQSFAAQFTPNEEKFQKMDLQVQVTTTKELAGDVQVSLKKSVFIYNGTEQQPKVVVTLPGSTSYGTGDVVLAEGTDYTLSYENNKNAGTAALTVEGTGYYTGGLTKRFEIEPADMLIRAKDKTILLGEEIPAAEAYEYEISGLAAGDRLQTDPVLTCDIMSTDVTGRYDIIPGGADAGTNYRITYEKGCLTVAGESVSCTVTFDVQGYGTAPADQVGIKIGDTVERPEDPLADGYRFEGWYRDPACTKVWNFDTEIVQADMTLYAKWLCESAEGDLAVQEIADMYYTGKAYKPAVSVYDGETLLKAGRDYQLKYYNNTNANAGNVRKQGNGMGEFFRQELPYVEVIGKGNYTDTVKVNFNILPAVIGDGSGNPSAGVVLKFSDQLTIANKIQKPFGSIKAARAMKQGTDYTVELTAVHAYDKFGRTMKTGQVLENAAVPAGYAGEFLLTVQGRKNYEGSICKKIHVADKAHLIKNAKITLGKNQKNKEFTGEAVRLTPSERDSADTFTVKYGKTVLEYQRDYEVSYRNNDRVGKAELVITGIGEYAGEKTVVFNIKGKAFSARMVRVDGVADRVYTGKALTQNGVRLTYATGTDAERQLKYGTDYTISYVKNINKGTATMTFSGIASSGFSGSFKKSFRIKAADIAQTTQAAGMQDITLAYSKAGVKPVEEIVLTNGAGIRLVNGKDYTLGYRNNRAVADKSAPKPPTIMIKGKGNYAGQLTLFYTISKANLKGENIGIKTTATAFQKKKADGYVYKPAVKLTEGKSALRAGTDYVITYRNNTQAEVRAYLEYGQDLGRQEGAAPPAPQAVITGKDGSSYILDEEIVVPLQIYGSRLTRTNLVVEIDQAFYTGAQVRPAATVSYKGADGTTVLTEGEDYSVSYGANTASGRNRGSITISGKGPLYGGDVTVKFNIERRSLLSRRNPE